MRQLSTTDQMTKKLTTIGHSMTFNNEPNIIIVTKLAYLFRNQT